MKRNINLLILFALVLGLVAMPTSRMVQAASDDVGVYLIRFEDGIPADFADQVAAFGGNVDFTHEIGIAIVSGFTEAAATEFGSDAEVVAMVPNSTYDLTPIAFNDSVEAYEVSPQSPDDPTTAYFYPRQWNMRAIDADLAWAADRLGSSEVTVAILDTGIDYLYPDLDGLVDLSRSVSFVPVDDALVDVYFPGRHYVTDLYFHGTHVAATVVSNAYVAAGVTSQTTLMGVKVCSVFGECEDTAIVQGILYAIDNGADVINMSLGGYFTKSEEPGLVGLINSLFNYANSKGVTVVVSAGNDAIDIDHDKNSYKTYCNTPNTICVSATGPTAADGINGPWYNVDAPTTYTNYGKSAISVAAPGGTYLPDSNGGWVWAACSQTSLVVPICQTGTYIIGVTGTSMASPHVSGLASLLVEDFGRNPGRIKTYIQQTADDLGKSGVDAFYGKGRINVGQAVAP